MATSILLIHSSDPARIPLFLLSGFLGSAKTTLLNRVLKTPEFVLTAVVINEFGEIGSTI